MLPGDEIIRRYTQIYRDGLLDDIIPFWLKNSIDDQYGGYLICLNRDGSLIDTDKGVWQTGRFIWMLASLYNDVEKKDEWLQAALNGADFLMKYGFDTDGRMFFQLSREGLPVRKRRYVFSEAFAAIAFAALYRATSDEKYMLKAKECFDIYYRYTTVPGLISPKFTADRQMKSLGVPMIGIVTAQEMRKNLNDSSYNSYIDDWINEIKSDFIKPEWEAVMENVGQDGSIIDHFDGRILNPGHAIEAAWFILAEAGYRGGDKGLVQTASSMIDWMWKRGWDNEYGGILYFVDLKGLPVQEYWHDMKFWWPHNETIIATLMAYEATGEKRYFDWFEMIHDYSFKNFSDNEYGEWFGYLHRDGRLSVPVKGNIWKGPFHVPRMYLKVWQTLERIVSKN
ncbi:MAG: AGE family epimerase/isomerase [Bacteroidales bacterium]|nr:AGE family epimerase/isomerase [Bacteroidales bacterium]